MYQPPGSPNIFSSLVASKINLPACSQFLILKRVHTFMIVFSSVEARALMSPAANLIYTSRLLQLSTLPAMLGSVSPLTTWLALTNNIGVTK